MKFKKYKGLLSLLLSLVLTFSLVNLNVFGLEAQNVEEEIVQEVLGGLYEKFSAYKGSNPIPFPYGQEEGQYTNAITYMEDQLEELVPEYDVEFIYSSTLAGTVGSSNVLKQTTMDAFGNITPVYNETFSKPAFMGVKFKIGEIETAKPFLLYFAVDPIPVSDQEMVDKEASGISFDAIKGRNASQDYITGSVGELLGSTVRGLNTKPELYKTKTQIKWSLENIQGNSNALSLDDKNKTTVLRPNVGEGDGKFILRASLSHKEDASAQSQVDFDLTVPEFKGYKVAFRVTPADANFKITDSYYKHLVEDQYIHVEDGGSIRELTLHGSGSDGSQSYRYELSKEGYISQKANVSVSNQDLGEINISLAPSSSDDSKLESLEITSPALGSASIISPMEEFVSGNMDYTMTVGDIPSITIRPTVIAEGASVIVNAATSKTNTSLKDYKVNSGGTRLCYLSEGENTIKVTVKVPDSSRQEIKEEVYTLSVRKDSSRSYPLKGLTIKAYDPMGQGKNNPARPAEEVLYPGIDPGGIADEYTYIVNAYRDQIDLTPTPNKKENIDYIKVNNIEVAKTSEKIDLEYGDNNIIVEVKEKDKTESYFYNIKVRRKQATLLRSYSADGHEGKLTGWTGQVNFDHSSREAEARFNIPEDATVSVDGVEGKYRSGEVIRIPVGDEASKITHVRVSDDTDSHTYVIGFYRRGAAGPSGVETYLPAPGQFVNQSSYQDPVKTLRPNNDMVTLGAFGGSIVYRFDEPIENDPANPYGIDFIVHGNAFRNDDGSSASGASEPAAVMVSKDGEKWYELAGSLYYEANTRHHVEVDYTNPDPSFSKGLAVPWEDFEGNRGAISGSSHTQPYYPNPSIYGQYNQSSRKGYNSTYTKNSVTFVGNMLKGLNSPAFGYGDTHANDEGFSQKAVNPYVENHYRATNGDGMDLAWAVDRDGSPVQIDQVSYVKVYNPNLHLGGSTGEISPEIAFVQKAEKLDQPVGVTSDLTHLSINGKSIPIEPGKYDYSVDIEQASSFRIKASLSDQANLWANDHWVSSGSDSPYMLAGKTLRIIGQEGLKEPVIYLIHLENSAGENDNADLESLTILPGDLVARRDGNTFWAEVDQEASRALIKAIPLSETAKVYIDQEEVYKNNNWQSNQSIEINHGDRKSVLIEVVAKNGASQSYTLNLTRKASGPEEVNQTIDVIFKLVGDTTWINLESHKVPVGSTVKYLTDKVLANHQIPFRTNSWGTYIESIKGLAEFDQGPNSGWMYKVNGTHADVDGYAIQVLEQGDQIEWHYVSDYTKEEGAEEFGNRPFEEKKEEKSAAAVDLVGKSNKEGISQTTLEGADLADMIEKIGKVGKDKISNIDLNIVVEKEALGFSVSLPTSIFDTLKGKEKTSLTMGSDIGKIKLDYGTIKEINKNSFNESSNIEFVFKKTKAPDLLKVKEITVYGDYLYDAKILIGDRELSDFKGGKVELFFPLELEKGMKPEGLFVSHIKSSGETSRLKEVRFERENQYGKPGLIALTDSFSLFAISYSEDRIKSEIVFSDLPTWHSAYDDIMFLASENLIKGTGGGKFEPDRGVTRAEFTQMIANISGENIIGEIGMFADVLPEHWYFGMINWAYHNKLIVGVSKDHFWPKAQITRQDAGVIIKRYLDLKGYTKEENVSGPNMFITRSEAATMIVGVLKAIRL